MSTGSLCPLPSSPRGRVRLPSATSTSAISSPLPVASLLAPPRGSLAAGTTAATAKWSGKSMASAIPSVVAVPSDWHSGSGSWRQEVGDVKTRSGTARTGCPSRCAFVAFSMAEAMGRYPSTKAVFSAEINAVASFCWSAGDKDMAGSAEPHRK
eukprot:CAMPEP_0115864278 /NCGR_PEP_ID=MMETSP0287-20121206/19117_1 /TAXON_ID=412157 /ORGANISM="Chrysochromulina rotalis, Strain UIO044" /LENGTH=153 /DNA_ID=CAMNT_0003318741 /DNA_START=286 /DNA_END=747 /DNA_ORIENTATION=-